MIFRIISSICLEDERTTNGTTNDDIVFNFFYYVKGRPVTMEKTRTVGRARARNAHKNHISVVVRKNCANTCLVHYHPPCKTVCESWGDPQRQTMIRSCRGSCKNQKFEQCLSISRREVLMSKSNPISPRGIKPHRVSRHKRVEPFFRHHE